MLSKEKEGVSSNFKYLRYAATLVYVSVYTYVSVDFFNMQVCIIAWRTDYLTATHPQYRKLFCPEYQSTNVLPPRSSSLLSLSLSFLSGLNSHLGSIFYSIFTYHNQPAACR